MTNAVIIGTAYNTMANPTNKSRRVNTLPAGLFDMSMISPNPTVVSVMTVMYRASSRPCSAPPMSANPTTPTAVTTTRAITAMASRRLKRLNSERSPEFKEGTP